MTIYDMLRRASSRHPRKTAVIEGGRSLSYGQVHRRVRALARFLGDRGLERGDRVSILAPNSIAFFESYFAAARDGLILNPWNTRLSAGELGAIAKDAAPRLLIAHPVHAEKVEELLGFGTSIEGVLWTAEPPHAATGVPRFEYEAAVSGRGVPEGKALEDESAVAHLYYTSGTTGEPRGVPLTHRNVCTHAVSAVTELEIAGSDTWGHFAPMFHLADAWATFAATWAGGCHVMVPAFGPDEVLGAIRTHGVTLTNLVPTMLNDLIHHPRAGSIAGSRMRLILSGGAPIAPSLVEKIMETAKCDYVQTYGLTETSPYLTLSILKPHLRSLSAVEQIRYRAKTGRPFRGVSLRVVDDSFRDVAPDGKQVGEVVVRGDTVFHGYWNRPQETREAFHEGWFRTGDLAVLDGEGYIDIVDRRKDMIITGGENVYSIEVENVLYLHPDVREACVFGTPDERWGEAVTAAVVLSPGTAPGEGDIIAFCRERLSGFKTPKRVLFLDALPRTGSGKIKKAALRQGANPR